MKRLNLDDTWTECLKMWQWIAGQKKENPNLIVDNLKEQWLESNGFGDEGLPHDCFFCKYVEGRTGEWPYLDKEGSCRLCPAKKVDKLFRCINNKYHYHINPLAFYAKLVELNKKRKAVKRAAAKAKEGRKKKVAVKRR